METSRQGEALSEPGTVRAGAPTLLKIPPELPAQRLDGCIRYRLVSPAEVRRSLSWTGHDSAC